MRGLLPGILVCAALLSACASSPSAAGRPRPPEPVFAGRPRPGAVSRAAPSPSPVQVPTPPPTWTADEQPSRGFSLQYPPGWAPKAPATGGPDHVYYATQDAPAPLEMTANDVWLTVQVDPRGGECRPKLPGVSGGAVPAELAGRPTELELRDPPPGASEPTWKAYAATKAGDRCYVLWFVTLTKDTRTRELPTMLQILEGFRDLPQPAASPTPAFQPTPPPSPSPTPTTLSP